MQRMLRSLAAAGALCFAVLPAAQAEAPLQKTQAPGYHRQMLGDFEITALLDTTAHLPVLKLLMNARPEVLAAALKRGFLKETVETSVNAYLVNTGSKLVLIDTGTGGTFGPGASLIPNLKAAGYQPEQVDEIYITHMHADHVGGLYANGQRAFPNAVVRVDKRDAEFWLSEEKKNAAPQEMRQFFDAAVASFKPYQEGGKFKPFDGATELVPGVRAQPAYGHTPGHTIYFVESKGEKLVLWGDLMHVAAVQFDNPGVTIQFDIDSKKASAERRKAFADAARNGWLVGVSHVSFPGLGHLRPAVRGPGYVWVPLNYSTLRPAQ